MKLYFTGFLVGFCCVLQSFAQFPSSQHWKCYFQSYYKVPVAISAAPFAANRKQYGVAALVVGTGVGLYFTDAWIQGQMPALSGSTRVVIEKGVEPFGNGLYSGPILAGMFLYGVLLKRPKARDAAMNAAASFFVASLLTRGLKYALNRSRPDFNQGANFWRPFQSPFGLSFPSGHTTGAFAIASALSHFYSDYKYMPYVFYLGAGVVGLSRIYKGEHWASDVFAGALVGYVVGRFFGRINCPKDPTGFRFTGSGLVYQF